MEHPAYLFLITPLAELDEEAFEQSLVRSLLPNLIFSQRSVKGTSQTLFKGKDEEGRTRYLWRLELELVSGHVPPLGSALASLLTSMKGQLSAHGTVSFVAAVEAEIPGSLGIPAQKPLFSG
jgi:hypothetical protein